MRFVIILVLAVICNMAYSQEEAYIHVPIIIEQNSYPIDIDFDIGIIYDIRGSKISLSRLRLEFEGDSLITKKEKYYEQNLTENQIQKINELTNKLNISGFRKNYSRGVIDGVVWAFQFDVDTINIKVVLDNYYIAELDSLIRCVNNQMPNNRHDISFSFGFFDDFKSPKDTAIYYLPDFYISKQIIPEQYKTSRIMCFKKGYIDTEILDSISLCECRIYPKNKKGLYKKRYYWRAFRLANNSWKRKYYNNDNYVVKTEYIKDIYPYIIVEEKVYTSVGDKPSVSIYRYYKTEISNE